MTTPSINFEKMKIFLTIICFIFLQFTGISQTYFSPILSYEFSNLRKKDTPNNGFHFNIPPFSVKSLVVGFKIGRPVTKKIDLTAIGTFTKKNMEINNSWFIPYSNQKFNQSQLRLSLQYNTNSHFYWSIGGNVNFTTKIRCYYQGEPRFTPPGWFKEFGGHLAFGKKFKYFNIETYYYSFFKGTKWLDFIYIESKPPSALGIMLSHDFIVEKKRIRSQNLN
jgi:hypothetical protein